MKLRSLKLITMCLSFCYHFMDYHKIFMGINYKKKISRLISTRNSQLEKATKFSLSLLNGHVKYDIILHVYGPLNSIYRYFHQHISYDGTSEVTQDGL